MARIPKMFVVGGAAAVAILSLSYGLWKRDKSAVSSAPTFVIAALVIWAVLGSHLELRYYSMLFGLVFLGGHALWNWQITRAGGSRDEGSRFIGYGVVGAILGARFGHVVFYNLDKAFADPLWVFQILKGGLASHGATIGLTVAMFIFCLRRKVSFFEGADRFVFSAALGASLVRLGNLMNSEIIGRPTGADWGIRFCGWTGPTDHFDTPVSCTSSR